MDSLLSSPLGHRIALALLHFVWQGFVIGMLLRAGRGATPQRRYAAGLIALCVTAWAPVLTFVVLGGDALPALPATGAAAPIFARVQPWLLAAWLLGVTLMSLRFMAAYGATLYVRFDRAPLTGELLRSARRIGGAMGLEVERRVFVSARVTMAMAVGCVKPIVLIPLVWATQMDRHSLEAVIAHELAHIRRHDLGVNLVQRLVETVLFFHPAVWWMSRELEQARELCCDEIAVAVTRDRLIYAKTLQAVASGGAFRSPAAAAFGGRQPMNLLERIEHTLGGTARADGGRFWPAAILALASTAAITTAVIADQRPVKPAVNAAAPAEGEKKKEGDGDKAAPREGDKPADAKPGEAPKKRNRGKGTGQPGPREGDGAPKTGPRDGDAPKTGPRDGDRPRKAGEGDKPAEKKPG